MEVTVKKQEKQISAQRFVMNNLRNGIEYLKDHCKRDRTDGQNFHSCIISVTRLGEISPLMQNFKTFWPFLE